MTGASPLRSYELKAWSVYVVSCADGSLYTGVTTDLRRRIDQHNAGRGAKYTRQRRPVELVYSARFGSRSDAQKEEHRIKVLSRSAKLTLIARGSAES